MDLKFSYDVAHNFGVTVTPTDLLTVPPAPEQDKEYVYSPNAFDGMDELPETPRSPDQAPLAVQDVASVALHVSDAVSV